MASAAQLAGGSVTDQAHDVEAIQLAVRDGRAPAPKWDSGELCGRFGLAEAFTHPEVPPLLCLSQFGDSGESLGEIWFRPGDIPDLIRDLQWQWEHNYGPTAPRRPWHGEGPDIDMGTGPRRT